VPEQGLRAVTALRLVPVPRGAVDTALALARTLVERGTAEPPEVADSARALVAVLEGVVGRRPAPKPGPGGATVSGSGSAPMVRRR